ncbi:ArsR/SmtB family transcription factor [Sphingomonas xanthus]|uniref:Helix-turn-helix transcriptional regulator n=1 Tax=Sphingomonas xanthus TaxID=2594473 RepID=A0A516IRL0_9SPHN|nr:metalloregulator ArsR/SmtB family transcription factor [Sphingomonas xanthus]QDP19528.1 helix-turn-helix transcriptional regulator [Sphingomonas xanthus]
MNTMQADFIQQAGSAAAMLRALANEQRLLILCHLEAEGELNVSALGKRLTLGQSALSQHLAKLRDEGLVEIRREAQTVHYRIADDRVRALLGTLRQQFCPEL